ncbi:hypothetical protein D0469_06985 [Peribacillus saganii]|uniref:Right handed beta helix domain-containing protein n=1 Tax=Peribacillus saganii TaxID=2303992 RepID=A0A372LQ51_9BACI|nr:hypothetical protein [Peribacillus saganii]RFU70338.1 hypothetical protein D0469_06985 [Peribacillus saganii]
MAEKTPFLDLYQWDTKDTKLTTIQETAKNVVKMDTKFQEYSTKIEEALVKGQQAQEQGLYAKDQGDYAKVQGDYAKSQGNLANEKALSADTAATNANSVAETLNLLKQDVITATNNANKATTEANASTSNADAKAEYAKQQGDYAVTKATELEQRVDAAIAETTNSAEIIDARGGKATLRERLNEHSEQLAETVQLIKPTGTGNDSTNINMLIASGGKFLVKKGTYNIVEDIQVKSNTRIEFEKGAFFQKTATESNMYYMLSIDSVDDVEIITPQLIGDRNVHLGTGGEYGHAINIVHSNKVTIHEPDIKDCWGDGIYIGVNYYGVNTKKTDNIRIIRPIIDNVRRNGISICSGGLIEIIDPVIKNVNGTAPQAGIDIEPESAHNEVYLDKLIITNPITENCNLGITGYLNGLDGKDTIIEIKNHKDIGSVNGFVIFNGLANVKGVFDYENSILMNNYHKGISINDYGINMPTLKIKNPTIIDSNQMNSADDAIASAIYHPPTSGTAGVGNIEIENATVIDTREPKQIRYAINMADNLLKKVKIINPKRLDTSFRHINFYATESLIVDGLGVTTTEDTYSGGLDITAQNYRSKRRNTNATDFITYNLKEIPHSSPVTFEVTGNFKIVINAPTGKAIFPLTTVGQKLESSVKGSKITLTPLSDGNWTVDRTIGTWTVV